LSVGFGGFCVQRFGKIMFAIDFLHLDPLPDGARNPSAERRTDFTGLYSIRAPVRSWWGFPASLDAQLAALDESRHRRDDRHWGKDGLYSPNPNSMY
jgi:hypothetical protein